MDKKEKDRFFKKKNENLIFNQIINEVDFQTNEALTFTKCIFKEHVFFKEISAFEIAFLDCSFEKGLYIGKSSFNNIFLKRCKSKRDICIVSTECFLKLEFERCDIDEVDINGNYKEIYVNSSIIKKLVLKEINAEYSIEKFLVSFLGENNIKELRFESYSNYSNIFFKNGTYDMIHFEGVFHNRVFFEKEIIAKEVYFESCIIKDRLDFFEGEFNKIAFLRSDFEGIVLFYLYGENKKLNIGSLWISSCFFEKGVSLDLKELKELSLSNNNFKELFHLASVKDFENSVTVDLGGANQGNIIIENIWASFSFFDINFSNIYLKDIIFESLNYSDFINKGDVTLSRIKSGNYLNIVNSVLGKMNFLNEDINIFKEIVIADSDIRHIIIKKFPDNIRSYSKNTRMGFGIEDKTKNNLNLKNTYSQLKNIARINGDLQAMHKYKALEYKKALLIKKMSFDSILLFLNWVSNDNGRSWIRGIVFTIVTSYVFFCLYIYNIDVYPNYNVKEKTQDFILFFTSFPKLQLNKFEQVNKEWNVSLIIWFSRVFVSYGFYQTISAFRKYGKN